MSVVPENAPTMPKTARFWCFTWFFSAGMRPMVEVGAGSDDESIRITDYDASKCVAPFNWPLCDVGADKEIQTLVYQQEVCPESGKVHIQGYVEFSKPCRFQFCQAVLGVGNANHSVRYKTREACVRYCTKEDTRAPGTVPVVLGTCAENPVGVYKSRQGKRTDISAMVDSIKSGKRAFECLEQDPDTFVKYSRGMQEVRRIVQQRAATMIRKDLRVEVHWGTAGAGKTRHVYDKHGVENVFTLVADNSACWFDGYEGQPILLIDDFKGWITYSMLLKILDIYPLRVPVKGSFTYAAWTTVYITSNYKMDTWYTGEHDHAALVRRVHHVKQYGTVHKAMVKQAGTGTAGAGAGAGSFADDFNPPPALTRSYTSLGHVTYSQTDDSDDDYNTDDAVSDEEVDLS